ncbi:MAG: YifB family Mg chelatase-like AAA ATPase, partial [Verrucomicrobiota bacterium]
LRKEGPSFDLPMALGVAALASSDFFPENAFEKCCIAGELALNGEVRPIKGALSLAMEARHRGRKAILLPAENARQAAVVSGIYVYGIETLADAVALLQGSGNIKPEKRESTMAEGGGHDIDFRDVKGQHHVRRALEVAVSGGHNVIMVGPPGTGKSMMAKRMITIMPPMVEEEAIETTKIHSVAGFLDQDSCFVDQRPFRSPHHSVSDAGLLGGSSHPSPGEVSLAHHGILFLDELPEFRRSTLEVLRQPLEDGEVTISRASGSLTFPSRFTLVAAMNPCPCGYLGSPTRECHCNATQVEKYRSKISGPLLDRIDLQVEVPSVDYQQLKGAPDGESSETMRGRVLQARERQRRRFQRNRGVFTNADMTAKLCQKHCQLDSAGDLLLEQAMHDFQFSARAHDRILKVARTLADLAGLDRMGEAEVSEAIQYRSLDRRLWQ